MKILVRLWLNNRLFGPQKKWGSFQNFDSQSHLVNAFLHKPHWTVEGEGAKQNDSFIS